MILSMMVCLYNALITPNGILSPKMRINAAIANSMVAGNFENSSCATGNLLTKDVPKSSCNTPFPHSKY